MFKPLSTVLAAMVAGAAVAAIGFTAATAAPTEPTGPAAGQTTVQQLSQLRDRLDIAAQHQDTAGLRSAAPAGSQRPRCG